MSEATIKKPLLPLSVIILTHRNDARFIACLKSVQFAEEILVFDDSSHNDWQKLREQFRFTHIPVVEPITHFADVRNLAITHAQKSWVLFLDSDEVLSSSAYDAIAKVWADNLYEGVLIKRTDIFLGQPLKYGEPGSTYLVRLARKRNLKYVGSVHEVPRFPGSIGTSDITIIHESHLSIGEFIADISKYAKLQASEKKTSGLVNLFELCIYPPTKFALNYFFKRGFLDGYRGLIYATIMSLHSLFVRVYRYETLTKQHAKHSV